MSEVESAERRSWRRFRCWPLSGKAKVLLHHWSGGCRCCGGVRAHVTGKSCFGWPHTGARSGVPLSILRDELDKRNRPRCGQPDGMDLPASSVKYSGPDSGLRRAGSEPDQSARRTLRHRGATDAQRRSGRRLHRDPRLLGLPVNEYQFFGISGNGPGQERCRGRRMSGCRQTAGYSESAIVAPVAAASTTIRYS